MIAFLLVSCLALRANAAASTCATSTTVCPHDGSGNYISLTGLTYTASTGIFSGTIITNGCPPYPYSNISYSGATYTSMGGAQPTCTTATINQFTAPAKGTPAPASLRGNIGYTVSGINIYGPFDNGFALGEACSNNLGSCVTGTDVNVCFIQMQQQCGSSFQPQKGLDVCNGHANPYHNHLDFVCNYNRNATGHSALIGFALDGRGIYGYKESSYSYPTDLDYCGGHYGPVPAFTLNGVDYPAGTNIYHYHTTPNAPFTLGCYGPVTTKAACMALYPTCGTGYTTLTGLASDGKTTCSYSYDTDCPCFGKGLIYDYNQVCSVATTQAAKITYTAWTAATAAAAAGGAAGGSSRRGTTTTTSNASARQGPSPSGQQSGPTGQTRGPTAQTTQRPGATNIVAQPVGGTTQRQGSAVAQNAGATTQRQGTAQAQPQNAGATTQRPGATNVVAQPVGGTTQRQGSAVAQNAGATTQRQGTAQAQPQNAGATTQRQGTAVSQAQNAGATQRPGATNAAGTTQRQGTAGAQNGAATTQRQGTAQVVAQNAATTQRQGSAVAQATTQRLGNAAGTTQRAGTAQNVATTTQKPRL
ncbi:UNVERIFIED_CONTAM: hypothetical protein HDU68_003090 [Siphonaria sp. JEL0065]|nr:hypothetical protein HDU68_003090 [Siphonaria sp. JEL0065]